VVVNPGEEVARLQQVFSREPTKGCTQPPVVLLPTTLQTVTGPAVTDLFIVRSKVSLDGPCGNGFLMGVRLSHEQAVPPKAASLQSLSDVETDEFQCGEAHSSVCSDEDASSQAMSSAGRSAPAVLVGAHGCDDQDSFPVTKPLCPDGGDCLPASAVAWVDDCPVVKSLHELEEGERILCFDNVGSRLTYAKVLKASPAGRKESHDWVKITLADGGTLDVTADHPVTVQSMRGKQQYEARTCIHAGDLQANQHKLLMLKVVPTLVTKAERVKKSSIRNDAEKKGANKSCDKDGWMTIEVAQPQRHELLVSTRDTYGKPGDMIAVSSCDRKPDPSARRLIMKNFNNASVSAEVEDDVATRAKSAPPSVYRHRLRAALPASKSSDTASSVSWSSAESRSAADAQSQIQIGYITGSIDDGAETNRLTDLLRWKRSGFPSQGSAHGYTPGECRPCSFHFTWLRNPDRRPPCKLSYLCEYCHDDTHHEGWRSKYRKRRLPKEGPTAKIISPLKIAV